MKKPEKIEIFGDWDCRNSLRQYNKAIHNYEKFLPSECEIMDIVRRAPRQENGRFSTVNVAKAILKRIRGEK